MIETPRQVKWITTTHLSSTEPDRLYYFEPGCEWGFEEDDVKWYRISCSYWFGDWIETQNQELWCIHGGRHRAIYSVREDLMTLIQLKWL